MEEVAGFQQGLQLKLRDFLNPVGKRIKEVEKKLYAIDVFNPESLILPVSFLSLIFSLAAAIAVFLTWELIVLSLGLLKIPAVYSLALLPWEFKTVTKFVLCIASAIVVYPRLSVAFFNVAVYFKTQEKKEKIDRSLYSALCILNGLGKGGIPIQKAIEELANSNLEGVREEFAKIHTAVRYAGVELREAILAVAITTVSEKLSTFLRGLVNYIERKRDYSDYVSEFLTIDNLNRRVELENYSTKLKNLSAIFIALLAILPTLGIFSITSSLLEAGGEDLAGVMVYLCLPLVAVTMLAVFYMGSPEKKMQRRMARESMIAAFTLGFTVLASVYVERFLKIDGLVEKVLIAGIVAAMILMVFFSRALRREKKVENEIDTFLMNLVASSKTGAQLLTTTGEIGKELAPALAESQISPLGDSLKKHSRKVSHPFLSLLLYTLGCVVHNTRNLSDVLLGVIYEYHRYFELSRLRSSVAKTASLFALVSFFIISFTMIVIKLQLMPMFDNFVTLAQARINLEELKNIPNDTVTILASVIPLSGGAILSDYRKCFGTFMVTLSTALAFLML